MRKYIFNDSILPLDHFQITVIINHMKSHHKLTANFKISEND